MSCPLRYSLPKHQARLPGLVAPTNSFLSRLPPRWFASQEKAFELASRDFGTLGRPALLYCSQPFIMK